MSRVEELPDNYDESAAELEKVVQDTEKLNIASQNPANGASSGNDKDASTVPNTTPELPPELRPEASSESTLDGDELWKKFNETPLFMMDMDKAMENEETRNALEAIRAIQNEGTRTEVAQNFRQNGNEHTKVKRWFDGKEFYTQAIGVLLEKEDRWDKPEDPVAEEKLRKELLEACYANRALCHLALGNYKSTTLDCAQALKLNPNNIKAYFRSSTALFRLDKLDEAQNACEKGLYLDPANKPLNDNLSEISARRSVLEKVAARRKEEENVRQRKELVLRTALMARNIRLRKTDKAPDMEDAHICLDPDPLSPASSLVFPCIFLYPTDAQSDFIKSFHETNTITDHLQYILPLPWDTAAAYKINSILCYMETTSGLIQVGKKMSLHDILSGGKVEIVDELVKIFVVPKERSQAWIQEFKQKKGLTGS